MMEMLALGNKIASNTDSFFLGCLIWIPIGIWILLLIRQMVDQYLSFLVGFIAMAVLVGLGWTVANIWHPILAWVVFTVVTAPLILLPIIVLLLHQRDIHAVEVEALESGYAMLGLQPTNTIAKFKVAEGAWNCGYQGHAIALADLALTGQKRDLFRWEIAAVERWKDQDLSANKWAELRCLRCNTGVAPGPAFCPSCGAPYLADHARGRLNPTLKGQKWVASWTAGALLVVGMPYVSMSNLSNEFKVGSILLMSVLGIVALIAAFKRGPTPTT
ncbi:MAG: hypothetical protein KF812_04260 [Fimbriimonadaceae bacterium]|nr:hypothetical protein [Fimbriimonadaceae bacterium]